MSLREVAARETPGRRFVLAVGVADLRAYGYVWESWECRNMWTLRAGSGRLLAALRRWERRRRAPRRASRGQALVETALFLTVLLLLVAGGSDIATLLDDHLNIVYAAREGARIGSVMGADNNADCAILGAVQAALAADRNVTLSDILIYSADQNGLPISIQYEEEYTGATTCDESTGQPTNPPVVDNWPASARNATPFLEDSLGVELQYTYRFQFNLLGIGSFSGNDHAVMPVAVQLYPTPTAFGNGTGFDARQITQATLSAVGAAVGAAVGDRAHAWENIGDHGESARW